MLFDDRDRMALILEKQQTHATLSKISARAELTFEFTLSLSAQLQEMRPSQDSASIVKRINSKYALKDVDEFASRTK